MIFSGLLEIVVLFITINQVKVHADAPRYSYFITDKQSKSFIQDGRSKRQAIDCRGEGVCEHNKVACTSESDREYYCHTLGPACKPSQTCYLSTPCPKHYKTDCSDDACKGFPCQHLGTCTDTSDGYTCTCLPGYYGKNCQTETNECASNPCQNGGTCHDHVNKYTCSCRIGYLGTHCHIDINECASDPCQNGATCQDHVNSYTCSCRAGYQGRYCQTDTDECASNPCQNGATCSDHVDSYTCACKAGYQGILCQTDSNECASNPCQNGATCHDHVNSYTCACRAGFLGTFCQTDIDECVSNPCQNGATCHDHVNSYTCACRAGYQGIYCQTDIDECVSDPCKNGATCHDHVNSYTCACKAGYLGSYCQTDIDECISNPCQNGATCHDHVNSYTCACKAGYQGIYCQTDTDECASDPCTNGATCQNLINRFTCACKAGYQGVLCQTDIDECATAPCQNGATCHDLVNSFMCACKAGYLGIFCQTDIDECDSSPCMNGATCHDHVNSYSCACLPGFEGVNCEIDTDECASSPCQNGATCHDHVNSYTCTCAEDFTGTNCEIDMCRPQFPAGADVVFLLDASLGQQSATFDREKQYVKDFVLNFPIGPTDFQIALVTSSLEATVHFYLDNFTNSGSILSAVDGIDFEEGPSYTGKGLQAVRESVLSSTTGARLGVYKYIIVLTDGLSSDKSDTKFQADLLKQAGMHLIAIGIGTQIYHKELIDIASHWTRVFPACSKDAVNSILKAHVMDECPDCYHSTSDVAMVIDASSDVSLVQYYKQIAALVVLLQKMPIRNDGVHVSCIQYAKDVEEVFQFGDCLSSSDVITRVHRMRQMPSAANVTHALKHIGSSGFINSTGARSKTRKVALLLTSGNFTNENHQEMMSEAKTLKANGVTIVTISFGRNVDMASLLDIASDPAYVYVLGKEININDEVLYSLLGSLDFDICDMD